VALPAFARRTLAVQQSSISPARRAHSSKPASAVCCGPMLGQTNDEETDGKMDGWTVTVPLHQSCCAHYARTGNQSINQ